MKKKFVWICIKDKYDKIKENILYEGGLVYGFFINDFLVKFFFS